MSYPYLEPRTTIPAVTASGALTAGTHTPVDATGGPITLTLPTPGSNGAYLSIEKVDASTNAVTISGNIRGSASTISLVWRYETIELHWSAASSTWRPINGHKTKAALDAAYTLPAIVTPATVGSATTVPVVSYDANGRITGTTTAAIAGAADATTAAKGVVQLAGDLAGTAAAPRLAAITTGATVGSATAVPVITYDTKGRITGSSTAAITTSTAPVGQTVYADAPPTGQTAIVANGSTNDAAALNTLLSYVKTTYGGGRLVLPAAKTIKCNSTVTIPAGVQLVWPETTTLDFSGLGASTAIVINDNLFQPIVGGGYLYGPNNSGAINGSFSTTTASTGISVTGHNLRIDLPKQTRYFKWGVDLSSNNTYIVDFFAGGFADCAIDVVQDLTASLHGSTYSNSGERITFTGTVFANSQQSFYFDSPLIDAYFNHCSFDYSNSMGRAGGSHVFFRSCHIESTDCLATGDSVWGTSSGYLFSPIGSGRLYFSGCEFTLGNRSVGTRLQHIIDPVVGPASYGDGRVIFSGDNAAFFTSSVTGTGVTRYSDEMISLSSGASSLTFYTPFLTRWGPVSAEIATNDSIMAENIRAWVSATTMSTGLVTVSTASAVTANRFLRIRF